MSVGLAGVALPALCAMPGTGSQGDRECRGRVLRIGQADFGGEARSAGTRKAASNLSVRGDRAPSNAAASVTAVLASQGLSPVSRRSRSRNATQRNGASHALDASRSEAGVECRRGQRGSLAPWGAEQGWRVLRCFARLSGRSLKRQESKSRHACRPGVRAARASCPHEHSAGCERRSATERQRSGGPPVASAQQAQTDIVARRTVVPRKASCGASGLEGTTGSQTASPGVRLRQHPDGRAAGGGAALALAPPQAPFWRAVLAGGQNWSTYTANLRVRREAASGGDRTPTRLELPRERPASPRSGRPNARSVGCSSFKARRNWQGASEVATAGGRSNWREREPA